MKINKDYFDNIISPDFILIKASGERIGIIPCTEKTYDKKFNDLDEIYFTTYMYYNNKKNDMYNLIDVMKYVEVQDYGRFVIKDISVESEGTDFERKKVSCMSFESLLAQVYLENFVINKGSIASKDSIQFYNIADTSHSLLHLILNEKGILWKIGHVDTELYTMQRSFEVDRQDIYSFLMNDVATAFECVFLFDTLTNTINIYQEKNVGEDTDIHVSYNNLMKNTNISCSIEDIKTCLTVTGLDDLSIREINMGNDRIIMLDYYNSTEYMSEGLYNAYNAWVKLQAKNKQQYNTLLSQFQNYYSQINELTYNKMPENLDSTDWSLYGLNPLTEKLAVYEQKQAVSMKAGHGEPSSPFYESEYLPIYNTINAINSQIENVNKQLDTLKSEQEKIEIDMSAIANTVAMENNFTKEQLKELSTFIREDELNSDNFVVTDIMTDDERFDMLEQMLSFGEKELEKLATPQLSFSVDMVNIFAIPEFERLYGKFDVGNYIWVTLRDNYHVKAKLQTIHMNFYDVSDFSVTFGNVLKKDNKLLDISNALSVAESVSTSVSFNSSYWSQAYKDATNIGKVLADGLLAAGNYLSSGDDSEMIIDKRGIFVNTTSGNYAGKDSIFMGGGRILFTDDNWKTVSMAVGRANVNGESKFGVFADFCIASYIAGSTIEGGTITGTTFNNGNGTFRVDANGKVTASLGKIGGFDITSTQIKSENVTVGLSSNPNSGWAFWAGTPNATTGHSAFMVGHQGEVFASNMNITGGSLNVNNAFIVDTDGNLTANNITATGGQIANFTIKDGFLYNGVWAGESAQSCGISCGSARNGSNDWIFWSGGGAFRVDINGHVYANDVEITGDNSLANFGGGFNANTSFGVTGGALTDFNNLVVNRIDANYIYTKSLEAGFITANTIASNYATIGSLNAVNARFDTLSSTYATVSSLNAVNARFDTLSSTYATVSSLNAVNARFNNLNANNITAGTLSVDRLDINGILNSMVTRTIYCAAISVDLVLSFRDMVWVPRTINGTTYLVANTGTVELNEENI